MVMNSGAQLAPAGKTGMGKTARTKTGRGAEVPQPSPGMVVCRYCGAECRPRDGEPGYRNVCPECVEEGRGVEDVEVYRAGMSLDEAGVEWDIVNGREARVLGEMLLEGAVRQSSGKAGGGGVTGVPVMFRVMKGLAVMEGTRGEKRSGR